MLYSVEGLDGVGKSTIVKYVSEKYNIPIAEKPIKSFLELNSDQAALITEKLYNDYSSKIRAIYYLLGYLSVVEESYKKDLIMDRGFLSTYYFSCDKDNQIIFDTFAKTHGFPDLTIILYASIEERIKRIMSRNSDDRDLKKDRIYKDNYDKIFEALRRYKPTYAIINTNHLTQSQTFDIVSGIFRFIYDNEYNKIPKLCDMFSVDTYQKYTSYDEIIEILEETKTEKCKIYLKER